MQTKRFVIAFIAFHFIAAPYARAIESNCPWNLRQLMGKAADELEPSTQLALQDILKGVYDNPPAEDKPLNSKTSVADDLWLNDFQMWDEVKLMAELGRERLSREAADRKRRLMRASFFGAIGVLGGAAIVSTVMDKGDFHLLSDSPWSEADAPDEEEIGIKLHKTKLDGPVLELLKEMAECDPHSRIASAKKRLGGQFTRQEKNGVLLPRTVVDRLVTGGSESPIDANSVTDALLRLRKEYNVIICTRWGHPSQASISPGALEEIGYVLEALPKKITGQGPLHIVLSKAEYWSPSANYPEFQSVQLGKDGEMQYLTNASDYNVDNRLVEAIVAKRVSELTPEKVQRWEQAVGSNRAAVLSKLFSSFPSDAESSALKSFSYAIAQNPSKQQLQELERFNKEAADLLRETITELGFKTDPFQNGWKTSAFERRQEERIRKERERDRRGSGWGR